MRDFPGRKMPAWIAPDGTWITCPVETNSVVDGAWLIKTGCHRIPHSREERKKLEKILEDLKLYGGPLWQEALKDFYAAARALQADGYIVLEWSHGSARTGHMGIRRGSSEPTPEQHAVLEKYQLGKLKWKEGYYPNTFYAVFEYGGDYLKKYFPEEYEDILELKRQRAAEREEEREGE